MGRGKGETRYFPTLKGVSMDDPSGIRPHRDVAGLDCECRAGGAHAADELCPAADPQGHSPRARGNQNEKIAAAISRPGEGGRSLVISALLCAGGEPGALKI